MSYNHLTIAGITLILAIRLFYILPPFIAKSGIVPKRWQLWMLGDRSGKSPHRDDIVM